MFVSNAGELGSRSYECRDVSEQRSHRPDRAARPGSVARHFRVVLVYVDDKRNPANSGGEERRREKLRVDDHQSFR